MRKKVSLIVAAVMVLMLTACGGSKDVHPLQAAVPEHADKRKQVAKRSPAFLYAADLENERFDELLAIKTL